MKRIHFIIILLIILQDAASPQQNKYPTLWKGFISIGYCSAKSGSVSQYYNTILDSYKSAGVPIPTQAEFGSTLIVNTGVLITRLENIWFGLSLGYLYSPAYSSYEDYSGTLKVNGFVSSYEIALKIKGTVFKIDNFQFDISSQPGLAYSSACITEELTYFGIPQADYDSKWSAYTWGPSFQLTICPAIRLGEFYLSLDGGYRFAWNEVTKGKIESSIGNYERNEVMDISQDGVIFLFSMEKEL